MPRWGYDQFLYVAVVRDGLVKIGASYKPEARRVHLALAVETPVIFWKSATPRADAPRIEAAAHTYLRRWHCRWEWFWIRPEQAVRTLQRLCRLADAGRLPEARRLPTSGPKAPPPGGWPDPRVIDYRRAPAPPEASA